MPETVRQTAATRRAAQRFGTASSKGRLIRCAFANELDVRCDGGHINRLNKTIIKDGIGNTGAIAGFRSTSTREQTASLYQQKMAAASAYTSSTTPPVIQRE